MPLPSHFAAGMLTDWIERRRDARRSRSTPHAAEPVGLPHLLDRLHLPGRRRARPGLQAAPTLRRDDGRAATAPAVDPSPRPIGFSSRSERNVTLSP
jgi:hypothetical protein